MFLEYKFIMYFSSLQIYFISVVLFFFYFNVTEWLNYVRI